MSGGVSAWGGLISYGFVVENINELPVVIITGGWDGIVRGDYIRTRRMSVVLPRDAAREVSRVPLMAKSCGREKDGKDGGALLK